MDWESTEGTVLITFLVLLGLGGIAAILKNYIVILICLYWLILI